MGGWAGRVFAPPRALLPIVPPMPERNAVEHQQSGEDCENQKLRTHAEDLLHAEHQTSPSARRLRPITTSASV
jgi:hypothetical protein